MKYLKKIFILVFSIINVNLLANTMIVDVEQMTKDELVYELAKKYELSDIEAHFKLPIKDISIINLKEIYMLSTQNVD